MRYMTIAAAATAMTMNGYTAYAADVMNDDGVSNPRGVAELLLGSAGFEGGVAAEIRGSGSEYWQVRPEVFINEDSRVGAGVSLDWDLGRVVQLPHDQDLYVGPRVVYHNSNHDKWELGGTAIYSIPIFSGHPERNHLEIIGAAGYLEHRSNDGDHSDRFGGTLGLGYAYQF